MARTIGLGATILVLAALAGCSNQGGTTTAPGAAATAAPTPPAAATAAADETYKPRYGGGATPAPAATQPPAATPTEAAASATCEVTAGAEGATERIRGFAFPPGVSVAAGGAITWTNLDRAPHTVTFDDGTCASGSIPPGGSVTVTYTVPGSYPFHCAIHASMTGTLEVKG